MNYLLGPRIARLRDERAITQLELARALGVSASALSQWERGKRPFPPSRLARAAEVLGVPVESLRSYAGRKRRTRGRTVTLRPPYPPEALVEHVSTLGPHESEVVQRVRTVLDGESYRVLAEEFPRDTRWELLLAMSVSIARTRIRLCAPGRWRLPVHAMHDLDEGVGDHLLQPALVHEDGDDKIVFFGQVWLNLLRYGPVRVDFLVWYKRRGEPGYWLYIEVDDKSSHENKKLRDDARQLSLTLPGLRYENHVVQKPWFRKQLLADIRGLKAEAARRRRARVQRAHRFAREREQRAEERRRVG